MTIRAIVFDLGHTLWDITSQPAALERAYIDLRARLARQLNRDDLPEAAVFQRAVRDVLHEAAKTYFADGPELREPPPHEWVEQACRRLGVEVDLELLREVAPPLFATEIDGLVVAEGTYDAVAELSRAGYRLGCITNTLADTKAIRAMLRKHRFESMMESVVVSTEEGWRKPHRSLFDRSTRELGVAAAEAVFVGDSPVHDIGGAKAAGLRAVLTRQYIERPYPEGVPAPDAVIDDLSELRNVVLRFS
jgi:FMN phosphatase YigB (HAD superfamily)